MSEMRAMGATMAAKMFLTTSSVKMLAAKAVMSERQIKAAKL